MRAIRFPSTSRPDEVAMSRPFRSVLPFTLLALLALPGCSTMQELAALRLVTFAFSNVSDVRFVGIPIGPGADYSNLGIADAARLGAAIIAKQAPIELVAHVAATNPPENKVAARMVGMGWKLFVEDHQALAGDLGTPVVIEPGRTVDVPVPVRFDLVEMGAGGARDMFDLAVAIAGQGTIRKDLRFELAPRIETKVGPLSYPAPIVIRRLGTGQ